MWQCSPKKSREHVGFQTGFGLIPLSEGPPMPGQNLVPTVLPENIRSVNYLTDFPVTKRLYNSRLGWEPRA
jgi:hypothetical protein